MNVQISVQDCKSLCVLGHAHPGKHTDIHANRQISTGYIQLVQHQLTAVNNCQLPNKLHGHFATPIEYVISLIR